MDQPLMNPSVGAVIVSFQPDLGPLRQLVIALTHQVSLICLIDNGSDKDVVLGIEGLASEFDIDLTLFSTNRGIAAGHNAGVQRVVERSLQYVVLFDQDSVPAEAMIERLLAAHLDLVRRGIPVAAVGPLSCDARTGSTGKFVRVRRGLVRQVSCIESAELVEVDFLISSGTLIPLQSASTIGWMNEAYFIDHVDTEWCARARAAGLSLYGVCNARLLHSLGDRVVKVWFGRWREVALHSPVRDYYMVRNTVLLLKSPWLPWSWRLAHLIRICQFLVFLSMAAPPRKQRLVMMLKGIAHGIAGRSGAF